jgi:excisionase family DNA binding protein
MPDSAMSSPAFDTLLDVPTIARRLRVSEKTVRRLIDRDVLPALYIGRLLRVTETDFQNYLAGQRKQFADDR